MPRVKAVLTRRRHFPGMVTRRRLRSVLTALCLYAGAALVIGYFWANAYSGNHGLLAKQNLDLQIAQYLRQNPEAANALHVSAFRFDKQVVTGMTKEQVLILLGAPETVTSDAGEMEKLGRKYWKDLQGNVTEAWVYDLGWRFFFSGQKLTAITQYLERD